MNINKSYFIVNLGKLKYRLNSYLLSFLFSFYSLPAVHYTACYLKTDYSFNCCDSLSSGRGPRCAAWYEDKLKELKIEENQSKSLILVGGIKNWVKLYKGTKMLIELEDIA